MVDLTTLQPGPDGLISREAVLAAAGVHGEQRPGVSHDVLPVRGVHAAMAKRMTLSRSNVVAMMRGVYCPPATWMATSSEPKVNTMKERLKVSTALNIVLAPSR